MPKRKIRLEEIESFIFEHDVRKDGRLRKGALVHLGRITRKGGEVVAWACPKEGNIKWSYFFNPIQLQTMPVCETCKKNLLRRVDDRAKVVLESAIAAPASNTGVN